jgi:succinate dehydrogenase (ubiquinone) cytochrome b560 subunit
MVPLKFGVAFPIVYHSLAGYRHLVRTRQGRAQNTLGMHADVAMCVQVWDMTLKGIDNASADKSSKALFAASLAASAALAVTELP